MYTYDTVSEALSSLKKRGYIHDFNRKGDRLECKLLNLQWQPDKLIIDETHRFEGDSDPADEAVVFAIDAGNGVRGTFVNAYGPYFDEDGLQLMNRMRQKNAG